MKRYECERVAYFLQNRLVFQSEFLVNICQVHASGNLADLQHILTYYTLPFAELHNLLKNIYFIKIPYTVEEI